MTATASATLFTLTDVAVKLPADASWVDIPYVMEASLKGSHTTVELMGDNRHQDNLYHTKKMQVIVKANKHAMLVLEKVTGVSSAVSGDNDEIDFGREAEMTAAPVVTLKATTRAIDVDGTSKTAIIYLYKTKCAATFDTIDTGHGKVVECILTFDCFLSANDESDVALATEAFGRMVVPKPA